ncbi:hypothetical protein [Neorhizobium sp. DAR64861/K0K2]|uniref:hypothetical protein n=1 Tax=unclassified Neorhizobium TaxID=2629175 RepID=UPI003D285B8F
MAHSPYETMLCSTDHRQYLNAYAARRDFVTKQVFPGASQSIRDDRSVNLRLNGSLIEQFIVASCAPDTTLLGGKPNFSVTYLSAHTKTSADASIRSIRVGISDERAGLSDLYPTAQIF